MKVDGKMISIIGLKNQKVKEVAKRIQTVIDESGYGFLEKRVIIRCAPVIKRKVIFLILNLK